MPKVEKKDFMKRLNEAGIENSVLISLMEDLEDSWTENNNSNDDFDKIQAENTRLQGELTSLQTKYKERFMQGIPIENGSKNNESNINNSNNSENDEGLNEKTVIDIKEI